jgi:hypothetical protein
MEGVDVVMAKARNIDVSHEPAVRTVETPREADNEGHTCDGPGGAFGARSALALSGITGRDSAVHLHRGRRSYLGIGGVLL